MSVGSLRTRELTTTHLDSHLSCCSGRNNRQNVDRVCILRIGLPGSSCGKSLSFGAVELIWMRPPSILIRILPQRVKSGWNRPEPGNRSLFHSDARLICNSNNSSIFSSIGSFLIGRDANHSSEFSSVESDNCEGASTTNWILPLSAAFLERDIDNQPGVSTLYRSARMEQD